MVHDRSDAALAQRTAPGRPQHLGSAVEQESQDREDADELAEAHCQLREQQQTLELLQTEYDEVRSRLESFHDLRKQLNDARAERDAALAELSRPASSAHRQTHKRGSGSAGSIVLRKERQRSSRRESQREAELNELRAMLKSAMGQIAELQHQPKTSAPRSELAPPPADAAEDTPEDHWCLTYQDAQGRSHLESGTIKEVSRWFRKGLNASASQFRVSRSPHGPFKPIDQCPEFRALVAAAAHFSLDGSDSDRPSRLAKHEASPIRKRPATGRAPEEESVSDDEDTAVSVRLRSRATASKGRPGDWLPWLGLVVISLLTAFVALKFFGFGK